MIHGSGQPVYREQVIPPFLSLFTRFRPYLGHFFPFFLVFCAFSPPRRDGSNEPQAGTQGQETAGKMAKTRELGPSFDTPGANQRINWRRRLRAGLAPRGQPAQLDRLAQLRPGASAAGHGSRLLQSVAAARGRHGGRDVPAPNGT